MRGRVKDKIPLDPAIAPPITLLRFLSCVSRPQKSEPLDLTDWHTSLALKEKKNPPEGRCVQAIGREEGREAVVDVVGGVKPARVGRGAQSSKNSRGES